jgi:hypothetical protein
MAKGISIGIAADTRDFSSDVRRGVLDPLEDVSKALDDVGTDSDKSGAKLEKSLDGARDDTKKLEKSYKSLGDVIDKETSNAGRKLGDNVRSGTDKAEEGLTDLKQEAGSTAKEAAASFQGIEDAGSALQEALANVFVGFGPAGAAAGIAAAIGVGILFSKLEEGKEETARFMEGVGELTTELIEMGRTGGPSIDYIVDRLKELATTTEDGETNLKDLADTADKAKRPFEDLAQAYAGSADDLDRLVKSNDDLLASLEEQAGAIDTSTNAGVKQYDAIQNQIAGQEKYNEYLHNGKDAADLAAEAAENYARSGAEEMEAKRAQIELINDAYDDAAGSATDFINDESKLFDTGAYIAAMQTRKTQLEEYQETLRTSALTPEAIAFLNSQGAEAAATFAAGYKAASPEQKAQLNAIWSEAGRENSGQYVGALQGGMNGAVVQGPRVVLTPPDIAGLRASISAGLNAGGAIGVRVQPVGPDGKVVR